MTMLCNEIIERIYATREKGQNPYCFAPASKEPTNAENSPPSAPYALSSFYENKGFFVFDVKCFYFGVLKGKKG